MIYTDLLQKSFADYFAFLRSGDFSHVGTFLAIVILFFFLIGAIIYWTYKN